MKSISPVRSFLSLVLIGALFATPFVGANNGTKKTSSCGLECPRNAPCRFGQADFSGRLQVGSIGTETHRDGMHCDCPIGWTGVLCDKKYETCSNQNGHECYNGGECILGLQDKYGNEQLFCDCSNADGYVGKYCETPFKQKCGAGNYCVNGGECNPNFPESSSQPCFCDEGWEGYHCEFETETVPECTLDCKNNGVCFLGLSSETAPTQIHRWSLDADDHMSCLCPPGFGGRFCEAPAEQCGNGEGHACLNGGKCVTTNTSVENANGMVRSQHHCDCTVASNEKNDRFAGKFCEHKATSVCSDNDWGLFCTQGGSCKNNPIEGCSCRSGTAGYKCEFILDNLDQSAKEDEIINISVNDSDNSIISINNGDNNIPDLDQDDFSTEKESCDKGHCLNGGVCATLTTISKDGSSETQEHCDCSGAFDASSNFAGKYCQYKSTSRCLVKDPINDDVLVESFCVHNGICQEDGSCDCPKGWAGQYCELKDLGFEIAPVVEGGNNDGVIFGVEACGDSVCYNGGVCATSERLDSNGDLVTDTQCDCSTAYDEKYLYAGEMCEFPSTVICFVPEAGDGLEGSSFCTNHGTCMDEVELGCSCMAGFYGFSCELETRNSLNKKEEEVQGEEPREDNWEVCGYGVCHHGGKCITTIVHNEQTETVETDYSCDCSTAYNDDTAFLGPSCEYPLTDMCVPPKSGKPLSSGRFCVNHGTCKEDTSEGCECSGGFTGKYCQFKIDLDEVDNVRTDDDGETRDFDDCGGDLICVNGGKCVTTISAGDDGEMVNAMICDCTPTVAEGDIFVGVSCEHKATSLCNSSTEESFCVNGGICQENGPCICDSPWKGDHCEIPIPAKELLDYDDKTSNQIVGDENSLIKCDLDCQNGGVCAQGAKDLGDLRDTIGDVAHLNQTHAEEEFAHCVCTEGWLGLTCEHKVEVCGQNQHACFHGSKCIPDSNSDRGYYCDCSQAGDGDQKSIFAGDSCQYKQTDICMIGDDSPGRPLYFCVNGGDCNAWVAPSEPDPGCTCPKGYDGAHCEVNIALAKQLESSSQTNTTGAMIAMFVLVAVFVALAGVLIYFVFMGRASTSTSVSDKDVPENTSSNGSPFPRRRRRKAGLRGSPPSQLTPDTVMEPQSPSSDDGSFSYDIDPVSLDFGPNDDGIMPDEFEDEQSYV